MEMVKVENGQILLVEETLKKMKQIAEMELQVKLFNDELKNAMKEAMESKGIKSFENEFVKITYVAPTERVSLDTKKIKAEVPELYEAYSKTSEVKSSVRVKYK